MARTDDFARVKFEQLFESPTSGPNSQDFEDTFGEIVREVDRIVRSKYGDIADSAVLSAARTFLRRQGDPEGEADADAPSPRRRSEPPDLSRPLFNKFVRFAFLKASRKLDEKRRSREVSSDALQGQGFEIADRDPSGRRHEAELASRDEIREVMAEQLRAILEKMNLLLEDKKRRELFHLLYLKMYSSYKYDYNIYNDYVTEENKIELEIRNLGKLTDDEIGGALNVSAKTVSRTRHLVNRHWEAFVKEARELIEAADADSRARFDI